MKESDIQRLIQIELSKHATFFRVNVGQAWTGEEVIHTAGGGVYLPKARRFSTGLPVGCSDLLGVVPVFITPEMVGQTIGRAAFIEVKTPTGRIRPEQEQFLAVMRSRGAVAGIARSPAEAVKIIEMDR
jgi:hypothetical protein